MYILSFVFWPIRASFKKDLVRHNQSNFQHSSTFQTRLRYNNQDKKSIVKIKGIYATETHAHLKWNILVSEMYIPDTILEKLQHNTTTISQFDVIWVSATGPGPWFNIKMPSYQYRKSHCGDKTILRPSYLHNGISYTGKITSLYWIRARLTYTQHQEQR